MLNRDSNVCLDTEKNRTWFSYLLCVTIRYREKRGSCLIGRPSLIMIIIIKVTATKIIETAIKIINFGQERDHLKLSSNNLHRTAIFAAYILVGGVRNFYIILAE